MSFLRRLRRRSRALLALTILLTAGACAPRQPETVPVPPLVAPESLGEAAPEARDALGDGLNWIIYDAPRMQVRPPRRTAGSGTERTP